MLRSLLFLSSFVYLFFSSSCSFNQFLTGRKVQFDRCAAFRRKEGAEAGRGLRARTLDSETRGERKIRRRERKRVARVCRFNATLLLRRVIIDARRRRSSFFFSSSSSSFLPSPLPPPPLLLPLLLFPPRFR